MALTAWWDSLSGLQQFFYYVAIPATAIMLVQTILMLIGLGGHGDVAGHGPIDGGVGHDIPHDAVVVGHSGIGHGGLTAEAHSAPAGPAEQGAQTAEHADASDAASFRLFTLQSILAFFVVFGWTGIAMAENRATAGVIVFFVSLLAGLAALFLTAWLFYALMKLQNSGNVKLANAVGLTGEVYIPIPANGKGQGKVNLLLQGRWLECDAVTAALEPLRTRQHVRVVGLQGGSVLVVEPVEKTNR